MLVLVLAVLAAACSSGVSTPASSVVSPTFPPPWTPATAAAPATPPPAPMQTFTGTGPDVVDLQQPVGFGIIVFSCPKCTGNTIVKTDARIDNLIVNRIGPYGGQHWIGARGDETSRVQVTAKGDWKLIVGDLSLARRAAPGQAVSGTGDEVVLYSTGPDTVHLTHNGTSNFAVWVMTDSLVAPDLPVNEIGRFDGTVMFPVRGSEAALVQITADGGWTMTPR
ncbi:hypothetical protein ACFQE5_22435 [Pseudonocardia hispaniensis]|uniref:Lipoprotein n=1 Tax=Pseudonocardia hispaniensis TaxID=904933 RepID=A0ABW1J7V5_9PSEU